MSLVINMVGGGGSFNPSDALIHVNAPLGSTVAFEKNSVVVATILPAKAFANVDGVTADYYYPVKSANYGTWTVTATLSEDSASDTVTVNAAKQYDMELSYAMYLFKAGAGAIVQFGTNNRAQVVTTITSDYIDTVCSNSSQQGSLYTANTVDFTGYETLHFSIFCTYEPVNSVNYGLRMHVTSNQPVADTANPAAVANLAFDVNSAFTEYDVDVSSISGSYYVGIWGVGSYRCNNIWLTR